MIFKTIKRWFRKRKLKRIHNKISTCKDYNSILEDFIEWSDIILEFVDEDKLHQLRFKPKFINISKLTHALDIMHFNVTHNQGKEYTTESPKEILLDDWLVDEDSYRITLEMFITLNKDKLKTIVKGLKTCSSSLHTYHVSNSLDILVTLQQLVKTCHYRKL